MLVSVVVPSYNHAPFVVAAIRSVVEQSYDDIELVIVDDASRDESASVIRELIERPDVQRRFAGRIAFHAETQNRGAIASINRGLGAARGDVLTLLNSDDLYHPERIERIVAALEREKADFAFTRVRIIDADGEEYDPTHSFAQYLRGQMERIQTMPTVGFALMRDNVAISTGNMAFRRGVFEALGGFRRYLWCHDWDFVLRALLLREPIFLEAPMYAYRMHGDNTFGRLDQWLGDYESDAIMTEFFAAVRAERYANPLAPSPRNWPGVFERIMIDAGKWPYWIGRR